MNTNYLLLGEAARQLGVPPYRLTYLMSTGRIPEPMRVGGRRVFTRADMAKISQVLGKSRRKGGQS